MKLDELLALDSAGWEKISDDDLKKFLDPFLKVTRPTKIPVQTKSAASKKVSASNSILSSNQDMIKQLAGLLKQTELIK